MAVYERLYEKQKQPQTKQTLNEFSKNFNTKRKPLKKKKKNLDPQKKKPKNSPSSDSNFDSVEREADFDDDIDEMSSVMKQHTHRTKTNQVQQSLEI